MNNFKCQTPIKLTLTLPSDADQVSSVYQVFITITHEWGDIVHAESVATRDGVGKYSYTMTTSESASGGVHKVSWRYIISSVTSTKVEHINIYQPYITSLDYFNNHPELEDEFSDGFDGVERKVRDIINVFCGQDFNPYVNKTIKLDGTDKNTLYLPVRLSSLSTVRLIESQLDDIPLDDPTGDISSIVEIAPQTNYFIRYKVKTSNFNSGILFGITGDWGWPWVPTNVSEAADILVTEAFSEDSTLSRHGVTEVFYGPMRKYTFGETIFGSTGNLDADILLMDYTLYVLSLI